jgi:hypothetical protein
MKFGSLCVQLTLCFAAAIPAMQASSITATSATCNSTDGAVGTFTCGAGAAQVGAVPSMNGFGFFISPTFQQFSSSVNGAAPLGTIVDGSHDPNNTPDGTSGCAAGVTVNQHCETLTFTSAATASSITAGSTLGFIWNNINLTLADFSGPNGSYIDQYFVEYIITQGSTKVVDWTSAPVNFAKTGSGTGSGPTSELNLSGAGTTVLGTTLNGAETVQAILTVGWVWLGPQTGTPAAAGAQGPGVDLDIKIGQGSLDLGVVPEPSTIGLAGLGLALVAVGIRKRKVSVQ